MEAIIKIDAQGRIDLPAAILQDLRVTIPGELNAQVSSGKLELTPICNPVQPILVRENGVLVAVNSSKFDAVAAIESTRDERL